MFIVRVWIFACPWWLRTKGVTAKMLSILLSLFSLSLKVCFRRQLLQPGFILMDEERPYCVHSNKYCDLCKQKKHENPNNALNEMSIVGKRTSHRVWSLEPEMVIKRNHGQLLVVEKSRRVSCIGRWSERGPSSRRTDYCSRRFLSELTISIHVWMLQCFNKMSWLILIPQKMLFVR